MLVSIDKRYPGHARKIMNAFWGLGQLMFSKTIIVVDKDVDVQNEAEVAWIVGTHYDPERDIQFTRGPVDDLEDASDLPALRQQDGHRRDAQVGRPKDSRARGRSGSPRPRTRRAKAEAIWQQIRQGMEGMTRIDRDRGAGGACSAATMRPTTTRG